MNSLLVNTEDVCLFFFLSLFFDSAWQVRASVGQCGRTDVRKQARGGAARAFTASEERGEARRGGVHSLGTLLLFGNRPAESAPVFRPGTPAQSERASEGPAIESVKEQA